jgi:hypothetical protein
MGKQSLTTLSAIRLPMTEAPSLGKDANSLLRQNRTSQFPIPTTQTASVLPRPSMECNNEPIAYPATKSPLSKLEPTQSIMSMTPKVN